MARVLLVSTRCELFSVAVRNAPSGSQLVRRTSSVWTRARRSLDVASQGTGRTQERKKHGNLFPERLVLPETKGYIPILSPTQVSSLLRVNEAVDVTSYELAGEHPIRGFESNQLASNSPIEDRRSISHLTRTGGMVVGVYDGHGGAACAQSVSERLPDYLSMSLLSHKDTEQFIHAMRTDMPMEVARKYPFVNNYTSDELQHVFRTSLQKYVVESMSMLDEEDGDETQLNRDPIADALAASFARLDADISAEAQPTGGVVNLDSLEVGLSGACACVAHIQGLNLHIANSGDTRAVLGSLNDTGKWVATPLTTDHNTENLDEIDRVRAAHPKSESLNIIKNNRLLGLLIPTRAFGDIRFKWSAKDLKAVGGLLDSAYSQSFVPQYYYTPPYLLNEPEITHHTLRRGDKFMVVASDGLWEMLSNEEVVRLVGAHLEGKNTADRFMLDEQPTHRLGALNSELVRRKSGLSHKSTDSNCATHLIRHSLGFEHRKVSDMLTFPPHISRQYRDDITITIVYFDDIFLGSAQSEMLTK